jgi:hypothetical protein
MDFGVFASSWSALADRVAGAFCCPILPDVRDAPAALVIMLEGDQR